MKNKLFQIECGDRSTAWHFYLYSYSIESIYHFVDKSRFLRIAL